MELTVSTAAVQATAKLAKVRTRVEPNGLELCNAWYLLFATHQI